MADEDRFTETLELSDLRGDFLPLRVGEEISHLKVASVKKISSPNALDNLAGVDYKFFIYTQENRILKVNSWTLWKQLAAVFRQEGTFELDLEVRHTGFQEYSVKVLGRLRSPKSEVKKPNQ